MKVCNEKLTYAGADPEIFLLGGSSTTRVGLR